MFRKKARPIETLNQPEQVRIVRSRRTLFVCAARHQPLPKHGLGRLLAKAAQILRETGLFGGRAV